MNKIVHCKKDKFDVYIGRTKDRFHYGNLASFKDDTLASVIVKDREASILAFRQWLQGEKYQDIDPERREWILSNLKNLKGKILGCWCAPLACHGSVLQELAEK